MRTYLTLLLLPLLIFAQGGVYGDTTVNLDAGQLTSPVTAPMQIDDNSGSVNGSLLLILDLGAGNSVSDTLSPGDFVSGSNTILAAGGFNDNGGTNETLTAFDVNAPATVGDEIALRWFPQITLAQYNLGRGAQAEAIILVLTVPLVEIQTGVIPGRCQAPVH